ncbi:D-aminoacyl-tRNA deacylase [Bergeyella zoohelcum]|uniref:D-aminoacyl-tRNA deacylase n=1 Tax=Bergeyella zoohelcum ATCC 43767 TaxID=883096 RepID=K1LWX5_9FLAO|nr:D-aminoacyl-tRNA deacylase [Bergeyella zoohelcum]EKB59546.1 D-tyrosyl-tRNA(Tyr) deacylase [Bergeyella zoohelcum ATCC 43767]SUV49710.1 D-tyrosyl-tRNA(Tyr) deacylase [Bergeyella zoohelcum]
MKVVIQRVSEASVTVNQEEISRISSGFLLLIGVSEEDTQEDADWLVKKVVQLRVFSDDSGKMNRSIQDIQGEILCVSQFTLFADYKKGNRPSFIKAAKPDIAIPLFEYFKAQISKYQIPVKSGVFGADMKVSLLNDGPVTILMDSKTKE